MKITTRELTAELWPALEKLFGKHGASSGCWCMFWRLDRQTFRKLKGEGARRRLRVLVGTDRAHGILAFAGDEPVGWCAFERRRDLPRLDGAPSLACDDAERVWSLPCLFIARGHRGRGVTAALLAAAEAALRARGAEVAEAYPTRPQRRDGRVPPPAAYTGVPVIFERCGFACVGAHPQGKQRYRKRLTKPPRPRR
jgi:GNAT superfamily N-acetyltransferase